MSSSLRAPVLRPRKSFGQRLRLDLSRHWALYLLVAPAVAVIAVFSYAPMYGVIIAFKNFRPAFGILDSPWWAFATSSASSPPISLRTS